MVKGQVLGRSIKTQLVQEGEGLKKIRALIQGFLNCRFFVVQLGPWPQRGKGWALSALLFHLELLCCSLFYMFFT